MLTLISPAKTLDFESPANHSVYTQPSMLQDSEALIDVLTTKSPQDIEKLMSISPKLAELNVERYHHWSRPFKPNNAKQAILAFKGDVYTGLEAEKFTAKQLAYSQDHLRILSGLYGLLRPLDLMQAYRLEMGTKLATEDAKNLYEFWDMKITDQVNKQLQEIDSKILLNLASKEYFKSIKVKSIEAELLSPVFKDYTNGQYKIVSFFAKKARGRMSAWVLKNKVKTAKKLIKFDLDGYQYSAADSSPQQPVFLRRQPI